MMFFISGLYEDQVPSFASFTQETPASAHEQTVPSCRDYMHLNKGLSDGMELSRLGPKLVGSRGVPRHACVSPGLAL